MRAARPRLASGSLRSQTTSAFGAFAVVSLIPLTLVSTSSVSVVLPLACGVGAPLVVAVAIVGLLRAVLLNRPDDAPRYKRIIIWRIMPVKRRWEANA